jgi:conjugative transfer signal peptidase TraF
VLFISGVAAAALIGVVGAGYLGGLRINMTPSYPRGLWRIVPFERNVAVGDLVFICPPRTPEFAMAWERGYLRSGLCPGWLSPLIKTIAATPGQRVEIADGVRVDGAPLAYSDLRPADGEGRELVPHIGGLVPIGHLFLHSEFAGSYDSRDFGPIPDDGLLGLAQPVLTLAP